MFTIVSQGDFGPEILRSRGCMVRLEDHCTVLAFLKAGSLFCLLSEYRGFSVGCKGVLVH